MHVLDSPQLFETQHAIRGWGGLGSPGVEELLVVSSAPLPEHVQVALPECDMRMCVVAVQVNTANACVDLSVNVDPPGMSMWNMEPCPCPKTKHTCQRVPVSVLTCVSLPRVLVESVCSEVDSPESHVSVSPIGQAESQLLVSNVWSDCPCVLLESVCEEMESESIPDLQHASSVRAVALPGEAGGGDEVVLREAEVQADLNIGGWIVRAAALAGWCPKPVQRGTQLGLKCWSESGMLSLCL
jgi:hypothetical protein